MLYLMLLLTLAVTVYVAWRLMRTPPARTKTRTRVIGPDDDPEFLWRLGRRDDDKPQR